MMDRREKIDDYSDRWVSQIYTTQYEDSCGWGKRMELLARILPSHDISGVLLAGPDGCGKHKCAETIVKNIDTDVFDVVYIQRNSLRARSNEDFDAYSFMFDIINEKIADDRGICLIAELPEELEPYSDFMDFLERVVCDFHVYRKELKPLYVIVIKNTEKGLPSFLRERLMRCTMTLPTKQQRRIFLTNKASGIIKYLDFDSLVEMTEGYSYSQLLNLGRNIYAWMDAQNPGKIKNEDMHRFVDICGEMTAEDSGRVIVDLDKPLKTIADAINRVADREPQVITQAAAQPSSSPSSNAEKPPEDPKKVLEGERDRFMKMSVIQLSNETLGEGFLDVVEKNHQERAEAVVENA